MKFLTVLFSLFFVSHVHSQVNLKKATPYAELITPDLLHQHLAIVAGPEMEGRETATAGQRKAAAYIAGQMKAIGLLPAKDGNYQISYPVYRDTVLHAALTVDGESIGSEDFAAPASNHDGKLSFSEVVFVNLDDSAWKKEKFDVTGRLVMFRPTKIRNQPITSRSIAFNISAIMKRGAAAAIVIDSTPKADKLGPMSLSPFPARQYINYFQVSPKVASMIMQKGYDSARFPLVIYKAAVSMDYSEQQVTQESSNVVGYLEGTTKKDEFIIISAHYDHEGKRDSLIWYGADDDGSGTVSVLALANAFAKAKAAGQGPERSVLFITFSGEEKGLWGSETYAANPVFPFAKTSGALNIDMIGRSDSTHIKNDTLNYVYTVGDDKLSSELPNILNSANKFTKLQLDKKYNDPKDPERIYFRSDHYNFAKNGVPVIFFYDGGNPDYHRVTDTVDKIDFKLMSARAKLVFYSAWDLANRPDMIVRDKPLPKGSR